MLAEGAALARSTVAMQKESSPRQTMVPENLFFFAFVRGLCHRATNGDEGKLCKETFVSDTGGDSICLISEFFKKATPSLLFNFVPDLRYKAKPQIKLDCGDACC